MAVNPVTSHPATTQHISNFLAQRGILSLQEAAGYIPAKMHAEIEMPPTTDTFAACADKILSTVCTELIIDGNPRTPFLLLTWHLVGSDNEQRINQHGEHPYLTRLIALMSLYIACGALPQVRKLQRIADYAALQMQQSSSKISRTLAWTAETLLTAATIDNHDDIEEVTWVFSMAVAEFQTLTTQAKAWCYVDDIEAGQIARRLLLDCLE